MSVSHESARVAGRAARSPADRLAGWLRTHLRLDVDRFIAILSVAAFASLFVPRVQSSPDPGWMSRTIAVPAVDPSDFQSSLPSVLVEAPK